MRPARRPPRSCSTSTADPIGDSAARSRETGRGQPTWPPGPGRVTGGGLGRCCVSAAARAWSARGPTSGSGQCQPPRRAEPRHHGEDPGRPAHPRPGSSIDVGMPGGVPISHPPRWPTRLRAQRVAGVGRVGSSRLRRLIRSPAGRPTCGSSSRAVAAAGRAGAVRRRAAASPSSGGADRPDPRPARATRGSPSG